MPCLEKGKTSPNKPSIFRCQRLVIRDPSRLAFGVLKPKKSNSAILLPLSGKLSKASGSDGLVLVRVEYPSGNDHISHLWKKEHHRLKSVLGRDMLVPRRVSSLNKTDLKFISPIA